MQDISSIARGGEGGEFFRGVLIQVKISFDIQIKLKICLRIQTSSCFIKFFVFYPLTLSGIFKVGKFSLGYFLGLVFGPGIFSGSEFYPFSTIPVT